MTSPDQDIVILVEKHTSLNLVVVKNKNEIYQITETTSFEDIKSRKKLNWLEHVSRIKNNDISIMSGGFILKFCKVKSSYGTVPCM